MKVKVEFIEPENKGLKRFIRHNRGKIILASLLALLVTGLLLIGKR